MIGICLNRLLLPVLRDFVAQEIPKHYTSLKSAHGIDTQVFGHFFEKDGSFELKKSLLYQLSIIASYALNDHLNVLGISVLSGKRFNVFCVQGGIIYYS